MSTKYRSDCYAVIIGAAITALLAVSGCSLPRVIVLNDPLSAEEHEKLGEAYESRKEFDLAAQQYREALKKNPQSASLLLLLGDHFFTIKLYPEAESAYLKALKLQPENGDIYNNLCWVYLEQHVKKEKSLDLVNAAMAVTPEHRAYYLDTRGVILLQLGRTSESISDLKEAVLLLPKDNVAYLSEAYTHLAEAYRNAGDVENAVEAEKKADLYRTRP